MAKVENLLINEWCSAMSRDRGVLKLGRDKAYDTTPLCVDKNSGILFARSCQLTFSAGAIRSAA
jgi:hypothetical protein